MLSGCLLLLGPPLAGKSTFARVLINNRPDVAYFSVRHHFEPRRHRGACLPPTGTLLDDDVVMSAIKPVFDRAMAETGIVLDGVPATAGQAQRLVGWLESVRRPASMLWFAVDRHEALRRAVARRVCVACDGGVGAASVAVDAPEKCRRCGETLTSRLDDNATGFEKRWRGFGERLSALLGALTSPLISGDGPMRAAQLEKDDQHAR